MIYIVIQYAFGCMIVTSINMMSEFLLFFDKQMQLWLIIWILFYCFFFRQLLWPIKHIAIGNSVCMEYVEIDHKAVKTMLKFAHKHTLVHSHLNRWTQANVQGIDDECTWWSSIHFWRFHAIPSTYQTHQQLIPIKSYFISNVITHYV